MSDITSEFFGEYVDKTTQKMLAPILSTLVAPTGGLAKEALFIYRNELFKATSAISAGADIVIGSSGNADYASTLAEELAADQNYDSTSINAQSGLAVKEAIDLYIKSVGQVTSGSSVTLNVDNVFRGILTGISPGSAGCFQTLVRCAGNGSTNLTNILNGTGVTITASTNKITINNTSGNSSDLFMLSFNGKRIYA